MARAIASVPWANWSNSNTPTGPFQTIVPAALSLSASICAVCGPMSSIRSSSATALAGLISAGASAAKALAVTTSTGIGTSAPRAFMVCITARAASSKSGSASDLPILSPAASIKVLAMPPPTISPSTLSARLCKMVSLVDTLLPATMAIRGRLGLASAVLMASISAASNGPAQAIGAYWAMP